MQWALAAAAVLREHPHGLGNCSLGLAFPDVSYSLKLPSHMPPDPAVEIMQWALPFVRECSGLLLLCNCGNAVMDSLSRVLSTFGRSFVLPCLALVCMRL